MRIEKIEYVPKFVKDFGSVDECEIYGIFDLEIVGVIFKYELEIGFYMNPKYKNLGYMYNALKEFIKPGYTFTVSKDNEASNNLLKKLNIKKIKEDFFYNYYLVH